MCRITISVLLILSSLLVLSYGQTFQYSRGWTNGKRSEISSSENQHPANDRYERLFQHVLKSPCDLQIAAALAHHKIYLNPELDILNDSGKNEEGFKREFK